MTIARSFSVVLLLVVVAALGGALAIDAWLERPLPLPRTPYELNVERGATLGSVARALAGDGVLPHRGLLVALARWRGVDRSIKAGNYVLDADVTPERLLAKLTQGDVTQASLTVVEGTTFAELKSQLRAEPKLSKSMVELPDAEIAKTLGIEAGSPEGWFFPDTYFFAAGSSDAAIFGRAHRLLKERLSLAWEKRAKDLPLASPYEALILASIVEKETGRAADRPTIASVFVNRLRQGMKLQTDPTVIYGLGAAFDGNLRRRDLESDTPYNTYTRDGLPPTPIALPGQASIEAVMNPPATPYLYFVARGDGTSEFSVTLAEHNRAVAKYQLKKR